MYKNYNYDEHDFHKNVVEFNTNCSNTIINDIYLIIDLGCTFIFNNKKNITDVFDKLKIIILRYDYSNKTIIDISSKFLVANLYYNFQEEYTKFLSKSNRPHNKIIVQLNIQFMFPIIDAHHIRIEL
jgi:hypothetical protein